jgi:hypothetical protein
MLGLGVVIDLRMTIFKQHEFKTQEPNKRYVDTKAQRRFFNIHDENYSIATMRQTIVNHQ